MNKCLFLDRDGVINVDYGYVYKKKEFIFREGIFDICNEAQKMSFKIIVITNQAGIGRGLYTESDFFNINEYMKLKFNQRDLNIDDVYFCPFHPKKGKGIYLKDSYDRKPNPGMILKAVDEHNLDIKNSIFIGDKESDRQAASNAGIPYFLDAKDDDWINKSINLIRRID